MSGLQCGCRSTLDTPCARVATQEDLLCDECRVGRGCNAVFVVLVDGEPAPGAHHHVNVSEVVMSAVESLPRTLRYPGDPERMVTR